MTENRNVSAVPREAREYQGRHAGLVTRMIAGAVDVAVAAGLLLGGYLGVNGLLFLLHPRGFRFAETSPLLGTTAAGVVLILYLSAAWSVTGRSYGCHLMGLRVVSRQGRHLQPHVALLRATFYAVFPVGLLMCAGGVRHRSLQDFVLRTSVVYDWRPRRS